MNDLRECVNNVKFKGKENVLMTIRKEEQKNRSLIKRINELLDYEIIIPTYAAISFAMVFFIIFGARYNEIESKSYDYTITVVKEGGQYEIY